MSYRSWTLGLLALAAACTNSEPNAPFEPSPPGQEDAPAPIPPPSRNPERDRHERFARRFAAAMRDPTFRGDVYQAVARSPEREGKVYLQDYLTRGGGQQGRELARLVRESEHEVTRDLDGGGAIEFYLPVPEHRRRWTGDERILIGTAETDRDRPVAFDLLGRRTVLSATTSPTTPVLMVGRAERAWGGPATIGCLVSCDDGGGGGSGGTATAQGLYLTQTSFRDTFEGWFKGDPEFEIHIMGPDAPGSQRMTSYQCIGQTTSGPYYWDQNGKTWTGSVMLFSANQLAAYRATHGNEGFRIFAIEDDDTACEIKIDSTRATALFDAAKLVYGSFTAAKDSTLSFSQKLVVRASTIIRFIKSARSFFVTNDDPVGNAVEDPLVASGFFSGATWALRGENSQVNGAFKLVMK
ncbi:MAG: hypothetical protein FJ206_14885 [Gemmatimonadetes bacterium]|nr:hypothetical protein [Gemmatimonadota bacterium]